MAEIGYKTKCSRSLHAKRMTKCMDGLDYLSWKIMSVSQAKII